jgi:chromosome segregation ATPase
MKMIDDMVALLKKEQADDEQHKAYCEGELDSSADEKKDLKTKLASLASAISEMRDEIAALGEKIAALTAENAALDKSVADATEQRKAEHSDFTAKVQLNEAAIQLIFKAKNRLNKFYNPDLHVAAPVAEPTEEELSHSFKVSFVQLKKISLKKANGPELEAAPETWEGGYQSKGKKSNSVMALMDRLSKELETEVKEAEHDEKTSQKDYEELMADAQENKAANTKSIADKNKSRADLEVKLEETKTQNIVTSDQLTTLEGYISDLHQSCDFILANFEVRREARTSEQESLVNAKAVLGGADFK